MADDSCYVVTGAGGGFGRAMALDLTDHLPWHHDRVHLLSGDANDPEAAAQAARSAEKHGPLLG